MYINTEYARRTDLRKHGRRMVVRLRGYRKVSSRVAPQEFPVPAYCRDSFFILKWNAELFLFRTDDL